MSKKRSETKHHIRPRSTFPPHTSKENMDRNNLVELDEVFHRHLHSVFGNLPPELYSKFLAIVLQPNNRWTSRDLERVRENLLRDWYLDQYLSF
jgi:hypothetical protein